MAIINREFRGEDGFQFYPFDEDSQRFFQTVKAGFVPAGPKGGAIVVLGRELVLRPPAAIYWLGEVQEQATDDLILKALDMKTEFKISEFVGRIDDNFSRYLGLRNAAAREQRNTALQVVAAPNSNVEAISYHVTVTRGLLNPTNKLLSLGDSPGLRAALQAFSKSEIDTGTAKEHPLLAALCYGVAQFEVNQTDYGVSRPTSYTANSNYNELDYNN